MGVVLRARVFAAIAMVLVQLAAVLVTTGGRVSAQEVEFAPAAPNRYIVQLKEVAFTSASAVASSYDSRPGVDISHVYTNTFNGFAGEFTGKAAADLARDPNVLA
ncbi:MAG: protease inhibitor I9 family protein, partial [Chloroflexota bacterium]|nr:protease inhibitor I9 family protein [Chloroflexota bacterium]